MTAGPGGAALDSTGARLRRLPDRRRKCRDARGRDRGQAAVRLGRRTVIRMTLYRTGAEKYLLAIALHHIAGDQWSIGVLGRELAVLYSGILRDAPPALAPLPISYRDYAVWQRNAAFATEFERQLSYWRDQLADLPVLDLPTDQPRPRLLSLRGALWEAPLSDALLDGLGPAWPGGGLDRLHDHVGCLRGAPASHDRPGRHSNRCPGRESNAERPPRASSVPLSTRW